VIIVYSQTRGSISIAGLTPLDDRYVARNHPSGLGCCQAKNTPRRGRVPSLRDLEPLLDIIRLTLYTAYITTVPKPNSLLVIARPESGKTEVLKKFIPNKNIVYLSDATAYGIERDYLRKIESGEIRHIIIPDLLKPLSRKESTVKTFITLMNALIEEGLASASTYAVQRIGVSSHVRCGVITAITSAELRDQRHSWGRLGFLSRIVPFSYSYGMVTVKKVFDYILGLDYLKEYDIELKRIPRQDRKIRLPQRYALEILPSTTTIAQAEQTYGFRLQKQFQALLQASALDKGRSTVNQSDVDRVLRLMNWVNFDERPIA
jgi:hypothetical protein